jgi:hypothetical protein
VYALSVRGKGINYDAGFINAGVSTREPFEPDIVRREMQIIHDDLHCTAVRITGGDLERIEVAASHAAAAGLEVWFSPFTCDLATDELVEVLRDGAKRAEKLRRDGAEVVFVAGAELSLFTVGFLPGERLDERLELLKQPQRLREAMPRVPGLVNEFLGKAAEAVRKDFGGRISYASIPWENVDWTPFDVVGVDLYRSVEIADGFPSAARRLVAGGKPVAITEFGCGTHVGAADKGARGAMIVEYDGAVPTHLDGDYVRNEDEQARYLRECLDVFETAGVDTAFVYTFANYHLPHRPDGRRDLDKAAFGVVSVLDEGFGQTYADVRWEPKKAFAALGDRYR